MAKEQVKEPVEAAPVKRDPEKVIGLIDAGATSADVRYVEHQAAKSRDIRLLIAGQNYEHCHGDADGVWVYRAM